MRLHASLTSRCGWLLSVLLIPACAPADPNGPLTRPADSVPAPAAVTGTTPASLRLAALRLRQDEATEAHLVRGTPTGLRADSPERSVTGRFDATGVTVQSTLDPASHARFSLASIGRAGQVATPVSAADPQASGHAVTWRRAATTTPLTESWQAGPLGLEHRIVVGQRPAGTGAVELRIDVGDLRAESDGDEVLLQGSEPGTGFSLTDYFVRDATGALLPGHMEVRDSILVYTYDDIDAVYPVEVDPLIGVKQTRLLGSNDGAYSDFGYTVALSSDGTTALIGNPLGSATGVAYVFARSGSTWGLQSKFTSPVSSAASTFGHAVSLSADGSVALVGDDCERNDDNGLCAGGAHVFTRSGGLWTAQARLLPADRGNFDYFGVAVTLSADGSTALIGATQEESDGLTDSGAAYVFVRSGSTWTQQQKLVASDRASKQFFANAVALSADGSTALIGDDSHDPGGAAYVFVRSGSTWTQQQFLLSSDLAADDNFGGRVALSADGSTALISAAGDDDVINDSGSAYVFHRTGTAWAQQTKLDRLGKTSSDFYVTFGSSLSLSADGTRALISTLKRPDYLGKTAQGVVYLFASTGGVWSQQSSIPSPTGSNTDWFGTPLALSADASYALIGAFGESPGGAAYVYRLGQGVASSCKVDAECASGFCVDGLCCDKACGGNSTDDCQACSVAAGATANGTCTSLTGTTCNDGNACTQVDSCKAGACVGASPVSCAAPDACHLAGSCAADTGTCTYPAKANGTACNDSNACTQGDTCQQGSCTAGAPLDCSDGNTCTSDTCDPGLGCTHAPGNEGSPCDGGTCTSGTCQPPAGTGGASGAAGSGQAGSSAAGAAGSVGEAGSSGTSGQGGSGEGPGGSGGNAGTETTGGTAGTGATTGPGGSGGGAVSGSGGAAGNGGQSGASGQTAGGQGGAGTGASAGQGGTTGGAAGSGSSGASGNSGSSGTSGQSGAPAQGGSSGQGAGGAKGGQGGLSGSSGQVATGPDAGDDGGCGCRTAPATSSPAGALGLLAGLLTLAGRRRRPTTVRHP